MDTHTFELSEEDRQLMILSLALTSLLRPGFDHATGQVAAKLGGAVMFEDFKKYNTYQVKPTHST